MEERKMELLQNLEAAIIHVYRADPELADHDVDAVLEVLAARYTAEKTGREPKPVALTGRRLRLYEEVLHICEWRLGRAPFAAGEPVLSEPVQLDELVAACKRLRKSVERWTRQRGRQGYLAFVAQYIH